MMISGIIFPFCLIKEQGLVSDNIGKIIMIGHGTMNAGVLFIVQYCMSKGEYEMILQNVRRKSDTSAIAHYYLNFVVK